MDAWFAATVERARWVLRARAQFTSAVLILFLSLGSQAPVRAQRIPPASNGSATAIAAAEASGAAHLQAQRTKPLPPEWDKSQWWGTEERKCVAVQGRGPARSGEFIIGGELGGDRPIYPRVPAKIWYAPLHNSESMDPLVVTGTRLSSPMHMRLALGTVAFPSKRYSEVSDIEYFFPSGTIIPDWGRWLLVATSGANWGCFIVTLGRG